MIKINNVEKERNRYKTKTTGASLNIGRVSKVKSVLHLRSIGNKQKHPNGVYPSAYSQIDIATFKHFNLTCGISILVM